MEGAREAKIAGVLALEVGVHRVQILGKRQAEGGRQGQDVHQEEGILDPVRGHSLVGEARRTQGSYEGPHWGIPEVEGARPAPQAFAWVFAWACLVEVAVHHGLQDLGEAWSRSAWAGVVLEQTWALGPVGTRELHGHWAHPVEQSLKV